VGVGLELKKVEKYPDWLYILFLTLPLLILYFRVLIGKTYLWDDALYLWYPYRHFAASSLSKGIFPLWNPYLLGGAPFQADIQSAIIYPFNLFLTPFISNGLLSSRMLQIVTILHVYLGGVFMFFLMKKLLNHKFSAFSCSLIYIMLPQIVYRSVQPIVLESMIWLPLLFLIAIHLVKKRCWLFSVLGGVIVALNLFAGFPHFAFMSFSLVSVYIFSYAIKDFFIEKDVKSGSFLILQSVTMFAIGAGLFAVQLLPSMEFTKIATRAVGWNYNLATDVSFHPLRLINVFIPKFFGNVSPLVNDFWIRTPYYSSWEMAIYFGMLPLAFAVYAFLRQRSFQIKFFAIAAVLSLWFAFGRYGFAYYLVYLTPVFHKFRCPARFVYLFNFSMIVLAGYGIRDMSTNRVDKKLVKKITIALLVFAFIIFLFVIGLFKGVFNNYKSFDTARKYSFISLVIILVTVLIFFKFENFKRIKYMPILLSLFLFLDLFLACFGVFEGPSKPEQFFAKNDAVRFFTRESGDFYRVNTRTKNMGLVFPRSIGCVHRFYTLQGLMPLRLLDYTSMKANVNQDIFQNLYNVKYSLGIRNGSPFFFENTDYLPRAKIYYNYLVEKEKEKVFKLLNTGEFDYRNTIILKNNPSLSKTPVSGEGFVRITEYKENSIILETKSEQSGILFLGEHYYPGWKAYIDDKEELIIKAFEAFRAIAIPAGVHKVKFVFKPVSFIRGRNISIVTLIFTTIIFIFSLIYYKKKP